MKVKRFTFMTLIVSLLAGLAFAQEQITIMSSVSCRTEGGTNAAVNRSDSSKLSVRASSPGAKSWIKFDLGDLDAGNLATATLTVALHEGKTGSQNFQVSVVNDTCLDNIAWAERDITWNNAPGNDPASFALLDPAKTTVVATVTFVDGMAGNSFDIDVLEALKSDTDGIVQFVLHNSSSLFNLSTHDHAIEAQRPRLTLTERDEGANDPVPANKALVETSLTTLSWTNPEPNRPSGAIACTVYLGTDPNRPFMDKVTLPANTASVEISAANFPRFAPLTNKTQYYWIVDCYDPTMAPGAELIPGRTWWFYTDDNQAPTVDLGPDLVAWLGMSGTPGTESVVLTPVLVADDGLPPGQPLTYAWTQVDTGAPAATIAPADQKVATVTLTARGAYQFTLTVNDSAKDGSDTIEVVIGNDACDASHLDSQAPYNPADQNRDCLVDLEDFVALIVANWLDCTDTLTHCGN